MSQSYAPWYVQAHAERLVLELRELLVRNDENLKAHRLLQSCVPYFLEDGSHAWLEQAKGEQARMVEHLLDPDAYDRYYATNVHERRFEDQYGIQAEDAHKHLWRVAMLREWLEREAAHRGERLRVLDLGCNDGWLAVNLEHGATHGLAALDGVDLHPTNVRLANERVPRAEGTGGYHFLEGRVEDAPQLTASLREARGHGYDAVVAFEVIEHVANPDRLLDAMLKVLDPGGRLFLSTPDGAMERGDLPCWWHVEPKGHVRVYTPDSLGRLIARHGVREDGAVLMRGPDGTLVAHWTPA